MTAIPQPENSLVKAIDDYHASKVQKPRPHLGASELGKPCDRALWYKFRWAVQQKFPGRMLRLFRRGHMEEDVIVDDLKNAGVDIRNTGRDQVYVKLGGHIGGSPDGIIEGGLPEAPKAMHVFEAKTHSLESFAEVQKNGVFNAKPEHWCQMQLYMHGTGIYRALYYAVCKDNDHICTDRVRYDKDAAEQLIARGKRISEADRLPDPISTDPSWYQCKFCPAHSMCHEKTPTEHVNCRTCAHSTAKPDGSWRCERHDADGIPTDFQRDGCDDHVLHPDFVPWPIKDSADPHEAVYEIEGVDVRNGHADAYVFSSKEILTNPKGCAMAITGKIKRAFPGAEVVG